MLKDIKLISRLDKDWRSEKIKIEKAGGQTNRNWIVKCGPEKFFVRFPWERTDIVDRKTEAGNVLAINRCKKLKGVVPECFLYVYKRKNILKPAGRINFPDGTMITKYIEGREINGKDLENPGIRRALLKTLHAFHSSKVKFVNSYDVFRDEVQKYRKKAEKYPLGKLVGDEKIRIIEKIGKIVEKNLEFGGKISTHNDLIFENLILDKNGKVYLIDFEYAGLNIRDGLHYDLGIILGGNLFHKNPIIIENFEKFLKEAKKIYGKDLDDGKIYCGALTNVLVMFWWGAVKYFSSTGRKEKKYFRKYVLDRAEGIESLYKITRVRISNPC